MKKHILISLLSLSLVHCAPVSQPGKISSSADADHVIYGSDSRKEPLEIEDAEIREVSRRSVALISRSSLLEMSNNLFKSRGISLADKKNLCAGERYGGQQTTAFCSGLLVAKNKILTAGHCVQSMAACSDARFVFHYERSTSGSPEPIINGENIYKCKALLSQTYLMRELDYALIELDRDVKGVTPTKLDFTATAAPGEVVFTIGYPSGISKKYARGVMKTPHDQNYLRAAIDAFGGNSGSPVFSMRTKKVIGIITNGMPDYVWNAAGSCQVVNNCLPGQCDGEWLYNLRSLKKYLSPYLQEKDQAIGEMLATGA